MQKKNEGKKELEIKDYSDIKSAIDSNSGGIRVCARLVSSHLQWWQRMHFFSDASLTDQCGQFLARASQRVKYSGRLVSVGDEGTRESLNTPM